MSVQFNQIPINVRVPGQYIEINNTGAVQGLSIMPNVGLLIGQMLSSGTATPLVPVLVESPSQAEALFGAGSQLKHMVERYLNVDSNLEFYAIPQVDNPAGAQATGSISLTGPATAAGTLSLYIGGRNVDIGVNSGDTAGTIATNVAAAINADTDLAVTAAVDGTHNYQVDLTAKHKGLCANGLDVRFNYNSSDATAPGVGFTIAALAGGSGNPNVAAVISALSNTWYTDIAMAYNDTANLAALETELTSRFGYSRMIDAFGYYGYSASYSALVTFGLTRNSPHDACIGLQNAPQPAYEWAAMICAACQGSAAVDPAQPVQTLPVPGALAPAVGDRFTQAEQEVLLNSGIATVNIDNDGSVTLQRIVTTYQLDAYGNPDPSYLDIETLKTLAFLRFDTRTYIANTFPRYKLADDGTTYGLGQSVVTPSVIRAALIARFQLWEAQGLVQDMAQFKADLIVERDASDVNRVNALIPPNVINQLRVFAGNLDFVL